MPKESKNRNDLGGVCCWLVFARAKGPNKAENASRRFFSFREKKKVLTLCRYSVSVRKKKGTLGGHPFELLYFEERSKEIAQWNKSKGGPSFFRIQSQQVCSSPEQKSLHALVGWTQTRLTIASERGEICKHHPSNGRRSHCSRCALFSAVFSWELAQCEVIPKIGDSIRALSS